MSRLSGVAPNLPAVNGIQNLPADSGNSANRASERASGTMNRVDFAPG